MHAAGTSTRYDYSSTIPPSLRACFITIPYALRGVLVLGIQFIQIVIKALNIFFA
jgi:hypothetical protein